MEDQLISLETAKLAASKGFDIPVFFFYVLNHNAGLDFVRVDELESQFGYITEKEDHNNANYILKRYSAPTQSLLQRWLREVHELHCTADCNASGWSWFLDKTNGTFISSGDYDGPNHGGRWETFEEALEVGLQITLNQIK